MSNGVIILINKEQLLIYRAKRELRIVKIFFSKDFILTFFFFASQRTT